MPLAIAHDRNTPPALSRFQPTSIHAAIEAANGTSSGTTCQFKNNKRDTTPTPEPPSDTQPAVSPVDAVVVVERRLKASEPSEGPGSKTVQRFFEREASDALELAKLAAFKSQNQSADSTTTTKTTDVTSTTRIITTKPQHTATHK